MHRACSESKISFNNGRDRVQAGTGWSESRRATLPHGPSVPPGRGDQGGHHGLNASLASSVAHLSEPPSDRATKGTPVPPRVGGPFDVGCVASSVGDDCERMVEVLSLGKSGGEERPRTMYSDPYDSCTQQCLARSSSAPPASSDTHLEAGASRSGRGNILAFPPRRRKSFSVLGELTASLDETRKHCASDEAEALRGDGFLETMVSLPSSEKRSSKCPCQVPNSATDDDERGKIILEAFNELSSDNRRRELLHVFCNMYFRPFERSRSHTADTWDAFKRIGCSDACCGFEFDRERLSVYVTIARRKYRFFPLSFLLRAIYITLFWALMYTLSPTPFSPGGLYFDTITTILFAGLVGCLISRFIPVPSLVSIIAAGLLYGNVPRAAYLTSGITMPMRNFVNTLGVAVGVIRAGLSMNVDALRKHLFAYLLFGMLPLLAEALLHGVLCKLAYNYPDYLWALLQGFLVSAAAPGVVAPVLIELQEKGYGTRDGPGMLILTSVSIEASLCVFIIQLLVSLEFKTSSTFFAILLVPLQIVAGALGGILLGGLVFFAAFHVLCMEAERIPLGNGRTQRMTQRHATHVRHLSVLLILLLALAAVSVARVLSCVGGGIFMALVMVVSFNVFCLRGGSSYHVELRGELVQAFTTIWDYVAMPAMFALSGADVALYDIVDRRYFGYTVGIILAGLVVRFILALLTPLMARMGFSWKELLFCGIGFLGKGSLQGPLGAVALAYAYAQLESAKSPKEMAVAQQRVEYARLVRNAAVLSTLIACPICSIFLWNFAAKLLKRDAEDAEMSLPNRE
ncbi:mitochondrial sodium/hydrogen exchanger NHA2 [Trypanosoma conorhini]|uniref:Mitochondrial sodium/hydrogen exchanger NHA2 n=1 Tax=Trypanosoma conorhini TaxID=83891 RepID=A0A3R7PHU2_9TRYP|nr:mitochondrial sodium/hydrogen exchanger NHA2 [Trypanosoma conorhini]RNF20138.1 mitochondrial sodium/hydrogen exchanger NHA2 [Trypanosoma conorhini]